MRIVLKSVAVAGEHQIPPGEYWVSVLPDSRQINLAGGGKDFRVPAIKRTAKSKVRVMDVQFFSFGGPTWTVLVKTPPENEWLAYLSYDKAKPKKKK